MAQRGFRTGLGRVATLTQGREVGQTWSFRGSKSRNKVSVGEPAEGSLSYYRGVRAVADLSKRSCTPERSHLQSTSPLVHHRAGPLPLQGRRLAFFTQTSL